MSSGRGKAFGRDINKFWNEAFPENCIVGDEADWLENYYVGEFEELLNLPEDEKFDLEDFGYIESEIDGSSQSFAKVFKKWLRQQEFKTIAIEVHKDKVDESIATLKSMGFKVVSK